MSPVTGLARLPGRILWCVHMGNFNPVDRDESGAPNDGIFPNTSELSEMCHSVLGKPV